MGRPISNEWQFPAAKLVHLIPEEKKENTLKRASMSEQKNLSVRNLRKKRLWTDLCQLWNQETLAGVYGKSSISSD